jgi:hypothetical protein
LVFRQLGYRVFYITSASAPNYFTFLGDLQEGQGTIAEDEADNIGRSIDKKNILKTGYCSGGAVPKVGFTNNGSRFQTSYLTFSHKWLAMEELPDEKNNRGTFDRSFIHFFIKGEVKYNIKEILKDKDSELYKDLTQLRKYLFAFKLLNFNTKFLPISTNLTARDAELTHFLLRMFFDTKSFVKIKSALSKIIKEKSYFKNNSVEAMITETLKAIMHLEQDSHMNKLQFTNDSFFIKFKEIAGAKDNEFDALGSTLYLSDGTKLSKYKLSKLLTSKFKAKAIRTSQSRGYSIDKENISKISKQYTIINEIEVAGYSDSETDKESDNRNQMTEMTHMTDFKGVPLSPNIQDNHDRKNCDNMISDSNIESIYDETLTGANAINIGAYPDKAAPRCSRYNETDWKGSGIFNHLLSVDDKFNRFDCATSTPSKCVTSVTSVTRSLSRYPCYFCGTNYQTNIDFDMGNHFVEKHKSRLIGLPISGNLETKIEWAITETKRRLFENAFENQNEDYEN